MNLDFLIIFAVIIFVFGNIVIYKLIVRSAIYKWINPELSKLGYSVGRTKFVGLFSNGDFKSKQLTIKFVPKNGNILNSTYLYLFIVDNLNKEIRITAKINSVFLVVTSVEYSSLPVRKDN